MRYKKIYLFLSCFFLFNSIFFISYGQNHTAAVNKLAEGLGSESSLKEARYIMFNCTPWDSNQTQGEHTYLYDWETKNCRFESETKTGEDLVALFNAKTKVGEIYINKKKIDSPALLKSITKLFTEDSYFLFTPILVANHHLKSTLQEAEIIDAKRYFVLKVSSPNSEFKSSELFIDSQTGLINKWNTFDKNDKKTHELAISRIKDVGGGLTLATKLIDKNGKSFEYPIVAALLNIEASKFETP